MLAGKSSQTHSRTGYDNLGNVNLLMADLSSTRQAQDHLLNGLAGSNVSKKGSSYG
jgi:hypothetical protein